MSISDFAEAAILDAVFNNVALAAPLVAIQLHTGEPGENGTANVATENGREAATFGAAVVGAGTVTSDADVIWASVAATETYTHISTWDNLTTGAGNCYWSGPLGPGSKAPATATTGDTFTSYAHGFVDDYRVQMLAIDGATLPTGVDGTTLYFVVNATADTFQVSLTSGGAAVDLTTNGEAIVQRVVPAPVNIGQQFIIPLGQIVVTLD